MTATTPTAGSGRYLILVLAATALTAGLRFTVLERSEPRTDQAAFAKWVQDLRGAQRILPQRLPDGGWRMALEGDSESLAHRYALRIYNTVPYAFTSVALAAEYLLSFAMGDSYRAQVGMSILASGGILLILGLAPWWLGAGSPARVTGLVALALAATSAYLHFWSSWGVHNWGMLSLAAAVAGISHLAATRRAGLFPIGLLTLAAIYSHWTNIFILPPAVALLLVLQEDGSFLRRLRDAGYYLALVGCSLLPVALLMTQLKSEAAPTNMAYAGFEKRAALEAALACVQRAGNWFTTGARMFSVPGLVLALGGLLLLAWKRGIRLPLLVVGAHWACWVAIPGFLWNGSPTWLRTYPYVLPLFCLGAGYAVAATCYGELGQGLTAKLPVSARPLVLTATGLVALHLLFQLRSFPLGTNAPRGIPEAHEIYGRGQGNLRPMVDKMDGLLPRGSALFAWNDTLRDAVITLSSRPREEIDIPPPLSNLWRRQQLGELPDYLTRRRITLPCEPPLFLLAGRAVPEREILRDIADVFAMARPACESRAIEPIAAWRTEVHNVEDVVLYAIRDDRRPETPAP